MSSDANHLEYTNLNYSLSISNLNNKQIWKLLSWIYNLWK